MADIQANTLKITIGDKTYTVSGGSGGGGVNQSQVESIIANYININKDTIKGEKGDDGIPGVSYSPDDVRHELTEEHVVGYLNGKPVYEKTALAICGTHNIWNKVGDVPNGLDKLISIYGSCTFTVSGQIWKYPEPFSCGSDSAFAVRDKDIVEYHTYSGQNGAEANYTIRYTKTTD